MGVQKAERRNTVTMQLSRGKTVGAGAAMDGGAGRGQGQ